MSQNDISEYPELPLDAVVVRAGIMNPFDLQESARNHYDRVMKEEGRVEWALSVNSIPDKTADEIAKKARKRHGKMCVSNVGEIEGLECVKEVRSDWREDGHSNVVFHEEPEWDDLEAVRSVFSDPVLNTGKPSERS